MPNPIGTPLLKPYELHQFATKMRQLDKDGDGAVTVPDTYTYAAFSNVAFVGQTELTDVLSLKIDTAPNKKEYLLVDTNTGNLVGRKEEAIYPAVKNGFPTTVEKTNVLPLNETGKHNAWTVIRAILSNGKDL